jgi:hypothetical protein
MSKEKLIAALPLAALFAALCHMPPASAAGQDEGLVVVRDPQTKQLRPPTAAELKALRPQPPLGMHGPAQPGVVLHPDGTRHVRIGEQGMVYSVVTRDAEGKLVNQCVQGEAAADAAVTKPAHDKEHSDETR